jgi:hypothetical protein
MFFYLTLNYKSYNMLKNITKLVGLAFLALSSESVSAQTLGTLTFSFTPISHTGYSGTKNALAVWIETGAGAFVKTKLRYAGPGHGTCDHLPTWAVNSGGAASNCVAAACNVTDATTGATLPSFTAKSITWDGKNVVGASNGSIVTDGTYRVAIEECWNHVGSTALRYFTFTKGPSLDHQTPAADANFTNIVLHWAPTAAGIETEVNATEVIVYPSPSTGVFNIDYNQASQVTVINSVGQIVFNEVIEEGTAGTKNVDLSKLGNGTYIFRVYNGKEFTNHQVVLNN